MLSITSTSGLGDDKTSPSRKFNINNESFLEINYYFIESVFSNVLNIFETFGVVSKVWKLRLDRLDQIPAIVQLVGEEIN